MTYDTYLGRYGLDSTPLPSTYRPPPTAFRSAPPPRVPLPPATTPFAPGKTSVQLSAARPPPFHVALQKDPTSRHNSLKKEVDAENAVPKEPKKRQRMDDDDEGEAGGQVRRDVTEDVVMSPRASQRRGTGIVPIDLSNRTESVEEMVIEEDAMDIEEDKAEERRRQKGKGKEVEVFKLPSVTPRIALVPVKMSIEMEEQSHYYLVSLWH